MVHPFPTGHSAPSPTTGEILQQRRRTWPWRVLYIDMCSVSRKDIPQAIMVPKFQQDHHHHHRLAYQKQKRAMRPTPPTGVKEDGRCLPIFRSNCRFRLGSLPWLFLGIASARFGTRHGESCTSTCSPSFCYGSLCFNSYRWQNPLASMIAHMVTRDTGGNNRLIHFYWLHMIMPHLSSITKLYSTINSSVFV
jgi:hypothetical protein